MAKTQRTKESKKQIRKYIQLGIGATVVILLAIMPMMAANREAEGSAASILSATVETKDIDTRIMGGGQLSSEASLNVRIPENVKLTQYLVGNGDIVAEGDAIAKVDKVSVMTAITQVQETLEYLAEEIADAGNDTASETVKALAGGRVKIIYAQEGESVLDVMLDHGALAVLSLDDTMAVKIERNTSLDVGDKVCVTFSDDREAEGRVKSNLDGVLTVTLEDDDYTVGEKVKVTTEEGDRIGSGELYIFSPWNATAYSGSVKDIRVEENDVVSVGRALFTLEETGHTAQFQRLIDQRQEYEELMQELFTMYRTETITAPCDGIVTGVDEDGAYLLADSGDGWFASLLSFFGKKEDTGFVAYAARVTDVTESGMTLRMDTSATCIADLAGLSKVSADISSMTEEWNYVGDTTIHTQNEKGLLQNAGSAKAGDILLAVGDENQVHWFVVLNGSSGTALTENRQESGYYLLSNMEGSEETPSDSIPIAQEQEVPVPEIPEGPEIPSFDEEKDENTETENGTAGDNGESGDTGETEQPTCTGAADCIYEPHSDSCKSRCDLSENCPASSHKDGCPSTRAEEEPSEPTVAIVTTSLNQGVVGQNYNSHLQATDGTNVLSGTWAASGLPADLTMDAQSGTISGIPAAAGSHTVTISFTCGETTVVKEFTLTIVDMPAAETYLGYVAQVTEVGNGVMKVRQSADAYTITDLNNLPVVTVDPSVLTQEATYVSGLITEASVAAEDYLLIVVDQQGNLKHFVKQTPSGGMPSGGMPSGGMPSGGMPSGGMGMGGMTQAPAFEVYSLEKLTVASITSQEHMTVSITIDELDITKIYVGQSAVVSVDALGGEQFDAQITKISNSGENDGGNSKFSVEVTLEKSGDMLPGMYASACITLETSKAVPSVPVAALEKDGTDTIVYTGYDADKGILGNPVSVTIGCSDGEYVQILDGLELGQTFYYAYYDTYVASDASQQSGFSFGMMGRR